MRSYRKAISEEHLMRSFLVDQNSRLNERERVVDRMTEDESK